MKNGFIQILERDHRVIEGYWKKLKKECEKEETQRDVLLCRETFQQFKQAIVAHAKAEETALYSLFESQDSKQFKELRHFSLEGYKEHQLVDQLIHEMNSDLSIDDKWVAQFTVLRELLEHHIEEEEEEFFPQVQSVLSREALNDLAEIYQIEHAEHLKSEKPSNSQFFGNRLNNQSTIDIESAAKK